MVPGAKGGSADKSGRNRRAGSDYTGGEGGEKELSGHDAPRVTPTATAIQAFGEDSAPKITRCLLYYVHFP